MRKLILTWLTLTAILLPVSSMGAETCELVSDACADGPSTKCVTPVDGGQCVNITRECWRQELIYECTGDPVESCTDQDLSGCYLAGTTCVETNASGECVDTQADYICGEQWTRSCEAPAPDIFCNGDPNCDLGEISDCRRSQNVCVAGPETRIVDGVPVTKNCWEYAETFACFTGEETTACTLDLSGSCESGTETCIETDSATGRCLKKQTNWICEGDPSCDAGQPADSCSTGTTTCNDTFDGSCVDETTEQYCYGGAPERCNADPRCTLTGTRCLEEVDGLCEVQEQIYECSETETICVEEKVTNSCFGDYTHGLDQFQDNADSQDFAKVASQMAVLDEIQRTMTAGSIEIFKGEGKHCVKPVLSGLLTNNCCSINVKDEGDNLFAHCTEEEISLAAGRRADRTVYIGSWCSNKTLFLCLAKTQGYCEFPSILSKVIQVQGRDQLAELANSGFAGATSGNLSFPLYTEQGGWSAPVTVNGNRLAGWSWPNYCQSFETAQVAYQSDPNAVFCSTSGGTWVASCAENTCGALPASPYLGGGNGWEVQQIELNYDKAHAISRYVALFGACDEATGQCQFDVSAWPAGEGGTANLFLDVGWSERNVNPGWSGQISQLANYQIEPYWFPLEVHPTVARVRVSTDTGDSWKTFDLPRNINQQNYTLPTSPQLTVFGSCNEASGQCQYRFIGPVTVTAKPWGSARSPDCSGFSLTELSVLDFSKMDLSEWIASEEFSLPDVSALADRAQDDITTFYDTYQTGQATSSPSSGSFKSLKVEPPEGFGTFDVTVTAASNWPQNWASAEENTDPVHRVRIDWGDGNVELLNQQGNVYTGTHTYEGTGDAGSVYTITAEFSSLTGTHQVQATVAASRTELPSSNSGIGGGSTSDVYQYNPSRMPGGPTDTGVDGRGAAGVPNGATP